jgi:hypothetical protein
MIWKLNEIKQWWMKLQKNNQSRRELQIKRNSKDQVQQKKRIKIKWLWMKLKNKIQLEKNIKIKINRNQKNYDQIL